MPKEPEKMKTAFDEFYDKEVAPFPYWWDKDDEKFITLLQKCFKAGQDSLAESMLPLMKRPFTG